VLARQRAGLLVAVVEALPLEGRLDDRVVRAAAVRVEVADQRHGGAREAASPPRQVRLEVGEDLVGLRGPVAGVRVAVAGQQVDADEHDLLAAGLVPQHDPRRVLALRLRDAEDGERARLDADGLAVLVADERPLRGALQRALRGLLRGREVLRDGLVQVVAVEDAVVLAALDLGVARDGRGPAAGLLDRHDAGADGQDLVDDERLATRPRAARARVGAHVVAHHRVDRVRRGRQRRGAERGHARDAGGAAAGDLAVRAADLEPVGAVAAQLGHDGLGATDGHARLLRPLHAGLRRGDEHLVARRVLRLGPRQAQLGVGLAAGRVQRRGRERDQADLGGLARGMRGGAQQRRREDGDQGTGEQAKAHAFQRKPHLHHPSRVSRAGRLSSPCRVPAGPAGRAGRPGRARRGWAC